MLTYLVRRFGIGLFTLLLITFIVYGLIRNMPGSPVTQDLARLDPGKVMSEEDYQRILKLYGLDKPWYVAYQTWIRNLLTGDLGVSFSRRRPVVDLILDRVGPTLLLSITSPCA